MSEELEKVQAEVESSVELHRKKVARKILSEAEYLVDQLLLIIHSDDVDDDGRPLVDAKTKLSAIGMLMDRAVPKLGVDNSKATVVEESATRKRIREEIENLMKEDGK